MIDAKTRDAIIELLENLEEDGLDFYCRPDSAERVKCIRCFGDDFFKDHIDHKSDCRVGYIRAAINELSTAAEAPPHVTLPFSKVTTIYSVRVPPGALQALTDSESDATGKAAYQPGNSTLCEKLEATTKADDVYYDGPRGMYVTFDIPAADDTPENHEEIVKTINEHLDWCLSLPNKKDAAA